MNEVLGQIAVGRSGSRGLVVAEGEGVLTLDCGGVMRQVARNAVIRFESQVPTPPSIPDPYPVGSRVYLKSWFAPFDPKNFKPEWWEVVKSTNQFGIILLKSDSGNWAGLQAWQIERDEVKS